MALNQAPPETKPVAESPHRQRAARADAVAVGTECFYRLRSNGELISARVISTWEDDMGDSMRLRRPTPGCVHLEIDLDPETHFASSERGLRLNVPQGNAVGEYQLSRPEDEDKAWAKTLERRALELEINRERARGRGL